MLKDLLKERSRNSEAIYDKKKCVSITRIHVRGSIVSRVLHSMVSLQFLEV